jgi:uncharacterized membrane protein YbhN (UPF0104 family)
MTRLLRVAFGVVVLAAVLVTTNIGEVVSAVVRADLWLVIPGLVALVAVHVIPALAWRRMSREISHESREDARPDLGRGHAIRLYYAGQALGGITPANLGGDVYRVAAMRRSGVDVASAALPVAVQRGTSFLSLSVLGLAGLLWLGLSSGIGSNGPPIAIGLAAAIAVVVGLASIVLIAPPRWLRGRLGPTVLPRASGRVGRRIAGIGLATGAAFHAVAIVATWLILLATDRGLATPAVLAAVAAARLSLAVPVSPSGIGVGEGVLAALVGASGGAAAPAVAGLLVTRLALVATTVIGATLIATNERAGGGGGAGATAVARTAPPRRAAS